MTSTKDTCPLCGGHKTEGFSTFTVDMKETLVVIRNVPVTLCALCGNEWLSDEAAKTIENIVADAKARQHLVEVTHFRQVA